MKDQAMVSARVVRFYFDFISPYSYLASQLIAREPAYRAIEFAFRPAVFGTVLSRLGVKGQGEIPVRRRYGMQDVLLLASAYGLPIEGPPTHPFNAIYALRSVCAIADESVVRTCEDAYLLVVEEIGTLLGV